MPRRYIHSAHGSSTRVAAQDMRTFGVAARDHRDVTARFGRHPHRNAVLGRHPHLEELDSLASGQLVRTRPPPLCFVTAVVRDINVLALCVHREA
jgi:hypothetical protein